MEKDIILNLAQNITASLAVVVAVLSLGVAFKSGVLRKIKFGKIEIEGTPIEKEQVQALIKSVVTPEKEPIPFETDQLAQYYGQVLAQSKTSFWFSLTFASIGFVVIILAGFMYSENSVGATSAQFFSGLVTDAVAGLFFVQSKNAQKSMGEFFDKLRRDRQQVESRKLCETIDNLQAKDALRIQLSLHYAEIDKADEISKSIIELCLSNKSNGSNESNHLPQSKI